MSKSPKTGGRLRNSRIERDKPADAQATDRHRGRCRGFLDGLLINVNEFLSEPQGGTRIHKDDARQIKALVEEFRAEAFELFRDVRIQEHGVRDPSIDDPAGADLSNVVSFRDRAAKVSP
jgi:hypothetical protein